MSCVCVYTFLFTSEEAAVGGFDFYLNSFLIKEFPFFTRQPASRP